MALDSKPSNPYSSRTMETITLTVTKRTAEENVKHLRKEGQIPGVIYGNKTPNTSIKCKMQDLRSTYKKAGESTLVEIHMDGQKVPSLIHAVTFQPLSGSFEHVDFYAVDMTKKVTTHVPIVFTGESPAVKDLGGILVEVNDHVTVTCLPKDLPHNLTVDISSLAAFRDTVTIAKLTIPEGVTIVEAPETVLITVQEPRKEEVAPTPAETEAAAAAAATTDGAAAPAAGAPAAGAAPAKEEKKK